MKFFLPAVQFRKKRLCRGVVSGIASIEQIAMLTLIFGVVAPMAWYLGSHEMETLTKCSSAIELSLFNGDSSHSDQLQHVKQKQLNHFVHAPSNLRLESQSGQAEIDKGLGNSGKNQTRILWVSLASATVLILGYAWFTYRRRSKPQKDDREGKAPLQKLRNLKNKLELKSMPGCVFTKRQLILKKLLHQLDGEAFDEMKVRHLLSSKIKSISPSMPVVEVANFFTEKHYRHVLVCDADDGLLGIITVRDLQRKAGETAADLMTTDIITTTPDQYVGPVITMMMEQRINCLPVVENERLIGIVTTTDMMIALQCTLQILKAIGSSGDESQLSFEHRPPLETEVSEV